jgi:hypothetical protein
MRNNGEGGGENEEREQNEIEKLRIGNRERYPATSAGFFLLNKYQEGEMKRKEI